MAYKKHFMLATGKQNSKKSKQQEKQQKEKRGQNVKQPL
jgi:hypothetical protein